MGSSVLGVVYGYQTKPQHDEWIDLSDSIITDFGIATKYVTRRTQVRLLILKQYLGRVHGSLTFSLYVRSIHHAHFQFLC